MTRAWRLGAWCLTVAGCVWLLTALGRTLSPSSPDPAVAAFALFRLAALAVAWYLAAVTAAGLAARALRLPSLVRGLDICTVAPVRRLLHATLSAGVTVTTLTAPAFADSSPPPEPAPVLRQAPRANTTTTAPAPVLRRAPATPRVTTTTTTTEPPTPQSAPVLRPAPPATEPATASAAAPPVLRRASAPPPATSATTAPPTPQLAPALRPIPPAPAAATTTTTTEPPPPPPQGADDDAAPPGLPAPEDVAPVAPESAPPPAPATTPSPHPLSGGTWRVGPGDSFWFVAESVVDGPEAEVARYWRTLVAANRDRLRHPDNPDLLYVGQDLVLPTRAPP